MLKRLFLDELVVNKLLLGVVDELLDERVFVVVGSIAVTSLKSTHVLDLC